jgi:hypothetical protein
MANHVLLPFNLDPDLQQIMDLGVPTETQHFLSNVQFFRNFTNWSQKMSQQLDALTAADADLKATFADLIGRLDGLATALATAQANNDTAGIQQVTADLQAMSAQAKAALTRDALPAGGGDAPPAASGAGATTSTAAPAATPTT